MKKRDNFIYALLFGLLMAFLFAFAIQEHLKPFKMKPLEGVFEPTKVPDLNLKNYVSGQWQANLESHIAENFGFREPIIRLYNQYVYDFYKKTYSFEITIGKDGWLYQKDGVRQYYGLMAERRGLDNDEFQSILDDQIDALVKVRAILQEYDVELMTFTLPVKCYVYPEHLCLQRYGDTMFNAGTYYAEQMEIRGFPNIHMTPWFRNIRDDYPFPLFYPTGSHWTAGAVIATDSLARYMGALKGKHLASIHMGEPYEIPADEVGPRDRDLALLLNTMREPSPHYSLFEIPVSIEADSNTYYPNVLFSGTSYYWRMTARVPFRKLFNSRDFMYYGRNFWTNEEQNVQKLETMDLLHELLTHDYVVHFRNEPQLYSVDLFPNKALIALCISDERMKEKTQEVADSLSAVWSEQNPDKGRSDLEKEAHNMLLQHPELFEELRGNDIPLARNPRIESIMKEKEIRADRAWNFLLQAYAANDSVSMNKAFKTEAYNMLKNKPLIKNNVYFTSFDYFDFLTKETAHDLGRRPDAIDDRKELLTLALDTLEARVQRHEYDHDSLMRIACAMDAITNNLSSENNLQSLKAKAEKRQISIDKMYREDALWCLNNNDNLGRYMTEDAVTNAFLRYKAERKIRNNAEWMNSEVQKHNERNEPFRVTLNKDIDWVLNDQKK